MLGPFQIALYRLAQPIPPVPYESETPRTSFSVTFEEVFAALEAWPRMFIEPDGSFVWVGEEQDSLGTISTWQLDGHLYDRAERLLSVELQGRCPWTALEQLIAVLGDPREELCVEQRREGIYLALAEFRKTLATG